jgi:hypothetical protein
MAMTSAILTHVILHPSQVPVMRDWRLKMLDRDRMHLNPSMMLERSSRVTDATPAKSNYILQPHVLSSDRNMRMPKPRD